MSDTAIDRVRVDVVSAARLEGAIRVGLDWTDGVAECASDVHVCGCVGGDEARVVSSPGSGYVGDWGSRRTRTGKRDGNCKNAGQLDDPHSRHV